MAGSEMCSCPSTTVVRVHSSGSYCGDAQHERLADALREMRTLDTDADADVEAAASDVLDALRKEPAPVPMPAPVVRSDRIELAAQVICDSGTWGGQWALYGESHREIYRTHARALAAAGLLADAVPAQQPAAEPEPCVIEDRAGDTVRVSSLRGPVRIAVDTTDTTWLTPDQADQLADALRAHAAARRADAQGGEDRD